MALSRTWILLSSVFLALLVANDGDHPEELQNDPFQCPMERGTYADPNNCRRFYLCRHGHRAGFSCTDAYYIYFDDAKKGCYEKTEDLQCGPLPINGVHREVLKNDFFQCPEERGVFADPNDCRRFYVCGNGHPEAFSCAEKADLYFDDAKKGCYEKTEDLQCGPLPINVVVRKRKLKDDSFQCPEERGIFADPNNCRRFYICGNGYREGFFCKKNINLYFDDARKGCYEKTEDLQCGPLPITTPVPTTPDPNAPPPCYAYLCPVPDCFCNEDALEIKKLIPGYFMAKDTPQMIILTFSGALNGRNAERFNILLNPKRVNRNGCPIKATFFVPHENTSYYYVQKLYGQGHEIAAQTITNRQQDFWPKATYDEWAEEVIGQREILRTFANVSGEDILGMRTPFLKSGGKNMLNMINDYGLDYDSSVVAPFSVVPIWPYAVFIPFPGRDIYTNCRGRPYAGIWEFPLNPYSKDNGTGASCVLLDECDIPDDPVGIFKFLSFNFLRHYLTNKAPFVMNFNVSWMTDKSKVTALNYFFDYVLQVYPDAWFVTMQQAVKWLCNPKHSNKVINLDAWKCPSRRLPGCNMFRTCKLKLVKGAESDVRYLQTCGKCPERYPWLNNIRGTKEGKSVKDLVQKVTNL